MSTKKQMIAEMLGTAWLVIGGCGSAVLATAYPDLGIGYLGVALAFGFALVTAIFAFGHISGGHFNPAVTLGLTAAGKFCSSRALPYIIAQVVGALIGASVIYLIAKGHAGFDVTAAFASNGVVELTPGGYGQQASFISEAVLTFFFVTIILHVVNGGAPAGLAALPIGLTLGLIHLISIPVTNTSVNPARSISQAVYQGSWAIDQLWLFIAAPIVGAVVAGLAYKMCCGGCCGTTSCSTTDTTDTKTGCCSK